MLKFILDTFSGIGKWIRDIVSNLSNFISRFIGTIRRFFQRRPRSLRPYNRRYDTNKWHWDARCKRWILKASETEPRKSYNCSEYTIGKLTPRAPLWGGSDTTTIETDEIEQELTRKGYTAQNNANGCGCVGNSAKPCAVVYFDQGTVVHSAAFDPTTCDWGGKLSARGPIARFEKPEHYMLCQENAGSVTMRFYCKPASQQPTYWNDEKVHDEAHQQ